MKRGWNFTRGVFLCALGFAVRTTADTIPLRPDPFLLNRTTPIDFRSAAMGGAGCAMVSGVFSSPLNPALLNRSHRTSEIQAITIAAGFGRDSLFSRQNMPVGASANFGEAGSVAAIYRYLHREENRTIQEGLFNYSTCLFENSVDHGAVDFGLNLRYQRLRWRIDHLPVLRTYYRRWSGVRDSSVIDSSRRSDSAFVGKIKTHQISLDAGVFQRNISERLDFGVTVHNVLGHTWYYEKPRIIRTIHSLKDTTIAETGQTIPLSWIDSSRYEMEYDTAVGWLGNQYRSLTVGVAYNTKILQNRVHLVVPLDLSISGLFARDIKTRFSLHAGAEAMIGEGIYLRLGYTNVPRFIRQGELISGAKLNRSHFAAGGGVKMGPMGADVYVARDEWGAAIGLEL